MPRQANISRRRTILAILALAFTFTAEASPAPRKSSSQGKVIPLRTITSLREAHSLSADQARLGYPIHVRAVVTYYDPYVDSRRIALFLHDRTGGIYAAVPLGTVWSGRTPLAGTLVDVSGISAAGDFAPMLDQPHIKVLGPAPMPHPKSATLAELLTGSDDGQWVEVEGVVRSVAESPRNITLRVAMPGGIIGATTVRRPGIDYQHLVDHWVHLRGNAAPTFNSNRQLTGARLYFPGLETLTAEPPGPLDTFSLPAQPIDNLMRFSSVAKWPHRVHVRGVVTLDWPGRSLCLADGTESLCAQTTQVTPVAPGSVVDVAGFVTLDGLVPSLSDAVFRPQPRTQPIFPIPITPAQALEGSHDADLVKIEGRLIGFDLESTDTVLVLTSGKSVFRAFLPPDVAPGNLSQLRIGSILRIVGVCSTQVDPHGTLEGYGATRASRFWILLRSAQDIAVLHTPSWWTAERIALALCAITCITIAGLVWVIVLRRRVEAQTRELRSSRERYRHMAHHDSLTGLPSRVLLQEHLRSALDRVQRFHTSIALLMLDLDNFKRINDSFGHAAGDRVLRVTAGRIRATIRKTDSVARMGGDEFIVLLNDLDDPTQAEHVASKIVAALSQPVPLDKETLPISVSVGVCTLSDEYVDAETLLRRVDAAMYRAKESGRACFQVFHSDMLTTSLHPASATPTSDVPSSQIR